MDAKWSRLHALLAKVFKYANTVVHDSCHRYVETTRSTVSSIIPDYNVDIERVVEVYPFGLCWEELVVAGIRIAE